MGEAEWEGEDESRAAPGGVEVGREVGESQKRRDGGGLEKDLPRGDMRLGWS